jgi:hypothetical protein
LKHLTIGKGWLLGNGNGCRFPELFKSKGKLAMTETIVERKLDLIQWDISATETTTPTDPMPPIPNLTPGCFVVLKGKAPIYRYMYAFNLLRDLASVLAIENPQTPNTAIIVASDMPLYREGENLTLDNGKFYLFD